MNKLTDYQKNFQKRIKKLNITKGKTIWDCIDRPIRPLVFELARIGMVPKFSCCGHSYLEEEEPKSHISNGPYVHFYLTDKGKPNFEFLMQHVRNIGWGIHPFCNLFNLHCPRDSYKDLYFKNDGLNESIHGYEIDVLRIQNITEFIQNNIPTVNEEVTIIDGNSLYSEVKEWQIKPKKPFTIKVEDYYKKYGKLMMNLAVNKDLNVLQNKIKQEIISSKKVHISYE